MYHDWCPRWRSVSVITNEGTAQIRVKIHPKAVPKDDVPNDGSLIVERVSDPENRRNLNDEPVPSGVPNTIVFGTAQRKAHTWPYVATECDLELSIHFTKSGNIGTTQRRSR